MSSLSSSVSTESLAKGLRILGLSNKPVAAHCSLRSFGHVAGGAESVLHALRSVCSTILIPGFQCAAKVLPPPELRYRQNGCNYAVHFDLINPPEPFDVHVAPLYPKLGAVCHAFARQAGTLRSQHPWHSWLGVGEQAAAWLADHPWESTNRPLERLAAAGGYVVLLGVGLSACTAVHLAEEQAGRRPFIRWAMDTERVIREVATSGCAKGFESLMPFCRDLFRSEQIGPCLAQAAPVAELINRLAPVIRDQPEVTRCTPECRRCQDAILWGPLPPDSLAA